MFRFAERYQLLAWVVGVLFLIITALQLLWLSRAVNIQQEKNELALQRYVPSLALIINQVEKSNLLEKGSQLEKVNIENIEKSIDKAVDSLGIKGKVFFSIYNEADTSRFISNFSNKKSALLNSEIKSCLSCIISFFITKELPDDDMTTEYSEDYAPFKNSEFQYFSPVPNIKNTKEDILWLSLYIPNSYWEAVRHLFWIFLLNLLLLSGLLYLFVYIMKAFSKQKKIGQIKEDFFNNITHELKTPISSIRLAAKVLQNNKTPEKNKSFYQVIEKESKTLERQIDQLLETAFLDQPELVLDMEEVNIHDLMKSVQARMQHK